MLVLFRCNDEHGNFTGRVDEVHVGDLAVLRATNDEGARLAWTGDASLLTSVRVGERTVTCRGERLRCVGNVYWDGVHMSITSARMLVRYLRWNLFWNVEEHATSGPLADLTRSAS